MGIKDKLEEAFNALQQLDMKPTPGNVSIMDGVYSFMKEIYKELEAVENAGENRTEVNPEGRNTD